MSVELVAEKEPGGIRRGIDCLCDVGDKVGFGPPILDGRGEQFPGCQMEVGCQHLRTMSDVVEFPPLDQIGPCGQCYPIPLDRLYTRFLIDAYRIEARRCILLCGSGMQRTDFLDLGGKLIPIINVGMFPIATAVWL